MNMHPQITQSIIERYGTGNHTGIKSRFIVGRNPRPIEKISRMRTVIFTSVLLLLVSGAYIYLMHSISRNQDAGKLLSAAVSNKMEIKNERAEVKPLHTDLTPNKVSIA